MKWNELKEKAKVKLLVDLRVLNRSRLDSYVHITPSDLDELAPIEHTKGSWFTIYRWDTEQDLVELFNEQTDDIIYMKPEDEIPSHFVVL